MTKGFRLYFSSIEIAIKLSDVGVVKVSLLFNYRKSFEHQIQSNRFVVFSRLFSPFAEVTVKYVRGLPHITVPLPSRNERCQFTLRPVTHSVGDFLEMLKVEDRGLDRATVLNRDGVRIASACSVETLMDDEFW